MKKVSILVPIYGVEQYIEQCARSLFSQSYPHCEFIFVDDASKDGSLARLRGVAAEYKELEQQIKIVELPQNGGVATARNAALDAATGEYILFVDADDWVDCQIVERLVLRALETSSQICNAWCMSVTQSGKRKRTPANWLKGKNAHLKAVIEQSHIVPNHVRGMLFERELFERHNLRFTPRVDFGEDYSLLPQLIYHAQGLATLPEYLYFYRVENQGSYMNNISQRHIANYIEAQRIVSRFIGSLDDPTTFSYSLEKGRLNIKKWIFRRGADPRTYNQQLFDNPNPKIAWPLLRAYNRVIDSQAAPAIKFMSLVVNFKVLVAALLCGSGGRR
ncbi:MAG: glycosyltransferase family A protein [Rikenellaceae bacterium]